MVKTQIQLPDDLYRALKRVAARQEWSLAETLRRGAEQLLQHYPSPDLPTSDTPEWQPPSSASCGWSGLTAAQLKDALRRDTEPPPPKAARRR